MSSPPIGIDQRDEEGGEIAFAFGGKAFVEGFNYALEVQFIFADPDVDLRHPSLKSPSLNSNTFAADTLVISRRILLSSCSILASI